ncbi:Wall-associated receptor kinase, galacturonan-binding domain containing protein [Parasponia andersonii]|uniref:Wall-associated receptor kinase, galacturonan-binding domain containing protein n=1 Tax=Parasponia andersonii TaxID=3476 RepID=A0A2P5E4K6_PARAD|nr:Wall-associated receptor kinase, galacturonan-binding domain containing protein [Parasponia andersonii]
MDRESTARSCDPYGETTIPYPLSTGPNCGNPLCFSFQCNDSTSSVNFKPSSGKYRVISINPRCQTYAIQYA